MSRAALALMPQSQGAGKIKMGVPGPNREWFKPDPG